MELGYWAVSHTDTYPILSFSAQYSPVHRYGLDTYPQRICSVSVSDTYRIRRHPHVSVFLSFTLCSCDLFAILIEGLYNVDRKIVLIYCIK